MSKHDDPFLPERLDEQIEALASVEPEEAASASNTHLISHLRQVYQEDAQSVAQVWARLGARTAENKRIMEAQGRASSSSLRSGGEAPRKGPGQPRWSRLLVSGVVALMLVILVGSTALLFRARQSPQITGISSTPMAVAKTNTPIVVDQSGLYISTQDELARINLQTGKTIWHIKVTYPIPVVMGGIVTFGGQDSTQPAASSFIAAVNAASGQEIWRKHYQIVSFLQGANGKVYASLCEQRITCSITALKASDGAKVWSYDTPSGTAWIQVQDGVVYGIVNTQFFALNATTGIPIWQQTLHDPGQQAFTAPRVIDAVLYFASVKTKATSIISLCTLYAVDATNGGERWHRTVNGLIVAPLTAADGTVYAGSREGILYALDARSGSLLWTYQAGGLMFKALQATHGVVYAETVSESRSIARLLALNVATRSVIWSKVLVALFGSGPDWQTIALEDGLIYAVDGKQHLSVFHADNGKTATSYYIATSSPIVEIGVVTQNAP